MQEMHFLDVQLVLRQTHGTMYYGRNSNKWGYRRNSIRGVLQELSRGILGFWTVAHITLASGDRASNDASPSSALLLGLGFRVEDLGFRVEDLGFRVEGLGLRV